MTTLQIGDKAPDFQLTLSNGNTIQLSGYKGRKLILYFYPKDDTPGCTAEACNLRDNMQLLQEKGFEIVGVSPDSEARHDKFSAKYDLKFNLIPDTEHKIMNDYGVWAEKSMYGKKYMGVVRTTFVIDENGNIQKIFEKVKTKEHSQQILKEFDL
ncbi:MAG: putative peroxiredoxin bcp [Bacteroidota bacterium]|jgi:peroxiredoxin Q/BCP